MSKRKAAAATDAPSSSTCNSHQPFGARPQITHKCMHSTPLRGFNAWGGGGDRRAHPFPRTYRDTFGCPPCEAGALETLGFAESRSLGVRSQNAVSHYALPVPVLATHHHFRCQCRRMEDLELQSCPQAPQQVSTQLGVGDQYTRYRHSARSGRNQGSPRYSSSVRPPAQPS